VHNILSGSKLILSP